MQQRDGDELFEIFLAAVEDSLEVLRDWFPAITFQCDLDYDSGARGSDAYAQALILGQGSVPDDYIESVAFEAFCRTGACLHAYSVTVLHSRVMYRATDEFGYDD